MKYKIIVLSAFTLLTNPFLNAMEIGADSESLKRDYQTSIGVPLTITPNKKMRLEEGSGRLNEVDLAKDDSQDLDSPLLPTEIISIIIDHLSVKSLISSRLVSKEFKSLIDEKGSLCRDSWGHVHFVANDKFLMFKDLQINLENLLTNLYKDFECIAGKEDSTLEVEDIAVRIDNMGELYFELGEMFFAGIYKRPDYRTALMYYAEALRKGCTIAHIRIGLMHETGVGLELNPDKANSSYGKYTEKVVTNRSQALWALAWHHKDYGLVYKEGSPAFSILHELTKLGDVEAQYQLGMQYLLIAANPEDYYSNYRDIEGNRDLQNKVEKFKKNKYRNISIDYLKQAAAKKHIEACSQLGSLLLTDKAQQGQGEMYNLIAAVNGNKSAKIRHIVYFELRGCREQAKEYMTHIKDLMLRDNLSWVGTELLRGGAVAAGKEYLILAADQGCYNALVELAKLSCEEGNGDQALMYCEQALATTKNPRNRYNFSCMLVKAGNYEGAKQLILNPVNVALGNPSYRDSMFNEIPLSPLMDCLLGEIFEKQGDIENAKIYYERAINQGHPTAQEKLRKLS